MEKREEEKDSFKKGLVIKWGIQYLSLSLIPLIVFVCFAYYSSSLLFESIKSQNRISLISISRQIDNVLDSCNLLAEDLLLSSEITAVRSPFPNQQGRLPSQDLYEATNSLRHLMSGYSTIEDAMIYSKDEDLYISSMRWGTIAELYMRDEFRLPFTDTETDEILSQELRRIKIYDVSYNSLSGERMERMLIIRPLSFVQSSDAYNLAVVVDVQDLLEELSDYNDFIIIQNDTGRILFDYLGSYDYGNVIEQASSAKDGSTFNLGNDIATIGASELSNFKYIILADKTSFYHYRNLLVLAAVVLLFICIGTCTLLIGRRIRNEWSDYEKAISALGDDFDTSLDQKDKYAPFKISAERMKAEREVMGSVIENQTKRLKENIVLKLVDSDSAPVSRDVLDECGIKFISETFLVLLFSLNESTDRENLEAIIQGKLNNDKCQLIPFPSSHGIAFLLSVNPDSSFYHDFARSIKEIMEENDGILRAAASDLSNGLDSVGSDYLDAINVLEYEAQVDSQEFMLYRDVVGVFKKVGFSYTTEDEIVLQQAIENGNEMEAKALVESFIEKNRSSSSPRTMRYLLFSIMGTILRTSNRLEQLYGWEFPNISVSSIIQSNNFNSSLDEVLDVLESIVRVVVEKKSENEFIKEESFLIYKKALNLIQKEFSDSMLNVSKVAGKLGVSNVYLSKVFKKYHGSNISDYIACYRIMVAKKYLSQDKPIKEIVDECGFGSLRTFLRQFKDKEHITPGQFRAMRKESANEKI